MKIRKVVPNNRRRVFEVHTSGEVFAYPYAMARPSLSGGGLVADAVVDRELGREAFTYTLSTGREGTVHIDQVLEYNQDPNYMADLLLYRLTLEVQKRMKVSPLSRRELIRRLGTSAAQFYRLLDQTNYKKSVRQMLALLFLLDCEVDFVVRRKRSA